MQGIVIITEQYRKECNEYFSKSFSITINKSPEIIIEEGPRYRMLVDITYLNKKFYGIKLSIVSKLVLSPIN